MVLNQYILRTDDDSNNLLLWSCFVCYFYLLLFLLFVFCIVDVFHLGDHDEYDDINMFYKMPVCSHIQGTRLLIV